MTDNEKLAAMASSPERFREHLMVDHGTGPRSFASTLDPWQRDDFEAMDNGWRTVAGLPINPHRPTFLRGYFERPRGHNKTSDIAASAIFALLAPVQRRDGVAVAGDQDQARLQRDAIERYIRWTPVLAKQVPDPIDGRRKPLIEVQQNKIRNSLTGSVLEVISSDAPSAFGLNISYLLVDELTHWRKRDLWDAVISTSVKKKFFLAQIIANAGFSDSWQWPIREAFRESVTSYFHALDGSEASWISPEQLVELQRMLPASAYARLAENKWSDGSGDALDQAHVLAAFNNAGDKFPPIDKAEKGWVYVLAIDLGIKKDFTAAVVLGREKSGRLRVCKVRVWKPTDAKQVDLDEVENWIIEANKAFKFSEVGFDPWNAGQMLQRLGRLGVKVVERRQNGTTLTAQCQALLDAFNTRSIDCVHDDTLKYDLLHLRTIENKDGTFRLSSDRGASHGHGDAAAALAIGINAIKDAKRKRIFAAGCSGDPVPSLMDRSREPPEVTVICEDIETGMPLHAAADLARNGLSLRDACGAARRSIGG